MSDQIKKLSPIIWHEIQKAQNILLHCHPSPDPDSIGSALALYHTLVKLGKKVTVIAGDSEISETNKVLPGSNVILRKNFFQINPVDYDLFLIVDTSSRNQISKLGEVSFPSNLKTVVIDHHTTNDNFADINLIETEYPAAGQMVYEILKNQNVDIDHDTAVCLMLAIYTDTGGFKYPKTTSVTFNIASELAVIAPDYTDYIFNYENQNEKEVIIYKGLALSSIKTYFSGQVAISHIPYKQLQKFKIKKIHTEKSEISNTLKSVIGWYIGICFTESESGRISVSFRTRDEKKYDVAKIAKATGFGGGHPAAAGATLPMSYAKALKLLLDTIHQTYPELGDP